MARKTVMFQGKTVEGESVEFDPVREEWSTYTCQDGTTLRLRSVVTEIIRLDEYNPQGDPIYMINSQNILRADIPEKLKRKKENLS
jgi:hypothetical protein